MSVTVSEPGAIVQDVRKLPAALREAVRRVPRDTSEAIDTPDVFTPLSFLYRIAIHGALEEQVAKALPHPLMRRAGYVRIFGNARGNATLNPARDNADVDGVRIVVRAHSIPWAVVRQVEQRRPDPEELARLRPGDAARHYFLAGIVRVSPGVIEQLRVLWQRQQTHTEVKAGRVWDAVRLLLDYDDDERSKREIDRALDASEVRDPSAAAAARIPCPWWWCAWFKVVLPTIHAHNPPRFPPWWRHTVTITPAQAKRVIDAVERLEATPDLLPPPDLVRACIRVLYISELRARNAGKTARLEDESLEAIIRATDPIYWRVLGNRYGSDSYHGHERIRRLARGEE